MKKMILVAFLSILLLLNPLTLHESHPTEAASTYYVKAKQDIILRDAANKNAKQIGTVKNYSEVKVLSTSTTWSYIQVNNKKGYVYTTALTKVNPKAAAVSTPVITGGLSPKAGRSYTYEPSFDIDQKKATYRASSSDGITEISKNNGHGYTYLESKQGLDFAVANSDVFFFSLSYPMKKGSTIKDTDYGFDGNTVTKVYVESTSYTLKTKAGTFKNTVVLKYPNGVTIYLAKGFGILKITDLKGKTTVELIKVNE